MADKKVIQDVIQWDTVNWGKCLYLWQNHLKADKNLTCLEIGGRTGGLSLWAALKGYKVYCSDLENPEIIAKPLHQKYNVNIEYLAVNALNMAYNNHFDLIMIKSVMASIGAIRDKARIQQAVSQIHKALKPGGKLLFVENKRATPLHMLGRKLFTTWGSNLYYPTTDDMKEIFSPFSKVEYKTTGFLGCFGRTERQKHFLGKIDQAMNFAIPSSCNYVVYGVAEK
ncbi:MAG: class I SAM-dependent methyltransferase [Bacteroidetes bacterium]|nr:class I SAM-dependent methyltransferase [Bacteroidota bacterium]